ncbi:ABC transporter permease [Chitinimonas sp.]|uniref:ABC transporter permease n=1 Tax=Chitinimonas sp. TaxID=1934313 RepID=UPI0035B3193F
MKLALREPMVLFSQFALPVAMYAFFGMVFGHGPSQIGAPNFYDDYTSNFVALTMLNVALMNIGPSLVIYKERGFLKLLMTTPMDPSAIWLSAVIKSLIIFLVGFAELVLVGWLMFHKLPVQSGVQMLLAIAISAYCLFSLGFMLGAIFKLANTAFAANSVLFQLMLLLSGASIPLAVMPNALQSAANILPMTHVLQILRAGWHGQLFAQANLLPCVFALTTGTIFAFTARQLFRRSFT